MSSSNIAALGLGSAGCLFLRDLPTDRSLIGTRVAVDTDARVLRTLSTREAEFRLRVALPSGFRKHSFESASEVIRASLAQVEEELMQSLPAPGSLLLAAVALGGLAGNTMAASWLPMLQKHDYRLVSLVLMPAPATAAAERAETLLPLIARHCLSLCVVNPHPLSQALPSSLPVQRLFAMTSVLRVGHALDWQRLSGMLADNSSGNIG